ncbi:SpoIIIAH-like family protein [Bacillus sp. FJAT-50079]|uniref:SpoIIIAH-like family protein n=1 Tax=Bacillus sp. FJAT-50079 TaxID=2833577 RepID=UPI001BCA1C8E|nr:SpoIIIAH-like family protein [Bacillus sp. FJAT-50079]MBS4209639.1 SpoIIIAH-like family protein [Bacillus sp. FJAT-50079]
MLLKKQTVWLLTMLSLVVVLSVYYVTSDPGTTDLAAVGKKDAKEEEAAADDKDMKVITEAAGDEAFETMRLELQDKRSKERTDLTMQVASPELTAEEKNKLYEQMEDLAEYETKESTIESLIKSLGYSDALVRADEGQVKVTVKKTEHTREDAAKILSIVREEFGTQTVATVVFQPN